jgi:hypothetical protein
MDNPANILGYNSANNQGSSNLVVANEDGTLIERLEQVQEAINKGTGLALGSNRSIIDEIKGAALNYNGCNSGSVSITFAAGTTGAVATHEILTVTGLVRLRIIALCTVNVAGAGSVQFGVEGATNAIIASTTGADLDAGELWYDATPTTAFDTFALTVFDRVINGLDVGYEVTADTLTGGNVTFYYWWEPLNSTGAVVAADGTTAL